MLPELLALVPLKLPLTPPAGPDDVVTKLPWSVPLPTKEFELTTVNGPLKPLPFCLNVPLPVPGFAAVVLTSVKLPLRLEKFHNIEKLPFTLPFVLLASKVPL